MKQVNEDLAVGFDSNGMEIKAERLQKWAYNQLSVAPDLLDAAKEFSNFFEVHLLSRCNCHKEAYSKLMQAIAKAEGRE